MFLPYKMIQNHLVLLLKTVGVSLKARYAGSLLGVLWVFLGPALLLAIYGVIYTFVFQVRTPGMEKMDYILYIFAGLVPFLAFSQALTTGAASLVADKALLLNAVFPAELIPLREVLASLVMLGVGLSLVMVIKLFLGGMSLVWLLLPVIIVLQTMATIGVVWLFSLASLVLKDVHQLLTYLIIILLIGSPISYTPSMLSEKLQILILLNPATYYIGSFQSIIVNGVLPPTEYLVGAVLFAFVIFHLSFYVFQRTKNAVMDSI